MDNSSPNEASTEQNFFCDICNLEYLTKNDLEEHKWSLLHHKKLDKEKGRDCIHKCTLCNEDMFGLLSFTKHIHGDEHQKRLQEWKTSNAEPTTVAEPITEANQTPLWAAPYQRFPRWNFFGTQQPRRHEFNKPTRFRPRSFPPPHLLPGYYYQQFMQQQLNVNRHRNHRCQFHNLSPSSQQQPITVHNTVRLHNPFLSDVRQNSMFNYQRSMPESHSSANSEGSFSVASKPSFTGFEATRKMREKLREINDRLMQTSDIFSLQPSSSQSTSTSIESTIQKNSHGLSRDVVVECQDSFKVISRDSENVESIATNKDSKEMTDTEAGRSRQIEESSRNNKCPFVGSREEEVLANFVAENLWNGNEKGASHSEVSDTNYGSLGRRETGLAEDHSHCSNRGLLTEEANVEDVRIGIGSKTIGNGSYNKKQSNRALSSNPPAGNALKDLLVFNNTFHNQNTATIEVLDKDPLSYSSNTQKVSAASGDRFKNGKARVVSVTNNQPVISRRESSSSYNNVYSPNGAKNRPDTAQNMNVFTGKSESEARSDAVKQVSCCTNSSFAGSALHKLVSSQARDFDSAGEGTCRSSPVVEVSVSEVNIAKQVSVSLTNTSEPQKSSDTTANIIEHLRVLLRERLPREEPANERAHQSEPTPAKTSGVSVHAKDPEDQPIFAKSKMATDEVKIHSISSDHEEKPANGSANTSLETSIISLDESLKSSNLSNQCEFRYKDGRRCPTSAEQKFCTYHAKVVRDVFIHHARATALQKAQADPERPPSPPKEEAHPTTYSTPCSVVDTGPSTSQRNSSTRQGSREENVPVSSSDSSTINLSDAEDSLSLQSRFRYLHKAAKNPLSGLDLSRTNLPPNIRKLLSKRDAKNTIDGEAISSSCQTTQRANDNDVVIDISSTVTLEQSSPNTSSVGITIQSVNGSIAAISHRPRSPVEVHSTGKVHTVTSVRNTVFSHSTISLPNSTHSVVNSATVMVGTSNRNQSLNVDGPTLMNKETNTSIDDLVCSHGAAASSDSFSASSLTLDKRQNLLAPSATSGICFPTPIPTTLSTSHSATTRGEGTLSCIVFTLPKEKPSFVSQGLSTYTVAASLSDVRDGTYHHAVELHKNSANGIRDIYRLATGIDSSLAQVTNLSQKQVENANVPLDAKSPTLNAASSIIAASGPIVNDSFCQKSTSAPTTTVTTATGVFSVDERSIRCLDSEITQAVDIHKMPTVAQSSSSPMVQSSILESGATDGEKTEHGQKSQKKHGQKEGTEREIADKQVLAEENSHCTKSKEHAAFLADSVQPKANNSSLEVDSSQRTMLRTFFDNLRRKKENRKEKGSAYSSRRTENGDSTLSSTAVAGVDTSSVLVNEFVSKEKSNEAVSKMEGGHERFKKGRQSMKRKVMEAESSEFKRRRVERGHNEEVKEYENWKKKEAECEIALETTRKKIKDVRKQILSLEEILRSFHQQEKRLKRMLEKISKEKHRIKISSDQISCNFSSSIRTSLAYVSSDCSNFTDTGKGKYGSDDLIETGRSSRIEWRTMRDLGFGSDYMLCCKEANRKAKKKKSKSHRKKVFGNNFRDMVDTGLNRIEDKDRASVVKTPALTDVHVEVSNSVQTSSFEKTDSVVIKGSAFEESEISNCSSEAQSWTGKAASSVSTPSVEQPNYLHSRSVTGGVNVTPQNKDLFQFQSDDDKPVSLKMHKPKSKSRQLKSPNTDHINNFTMQNKSFSGLNDRRSLRVQLTDIASLMVDKKLKVYQPYESPIYSLKSKLDLMCEKVETKTTGPSHGHVENQEKVNADIKEKKSRLDCETTKSNSLTHSKIIGRNDKDGVFESATKCREQDDSKEGRIKVPNNSENVSNLDSEPDSGLAKKSVDSTNDNSFPLIVDGLSESNAKDLQSAGEVAGDGKNYQNCLEKPDISRCSTNDKPSHAENQNNSFSRMKKLSHCEPETDMDYRDGSGSPRRTIFVTNSLNNGKNVSGEGILSKNQTQLAADIAPIVIEESNETVAANVDSLDATHKRKRGEEFGSALLDIRSNSQKKPFLKNRAGDCESPIRTSDNEEGMAIQSCSSKHVGNDVWKEASSRLKALINESLRKNTNKSESCSFSNESRSIDQSIENYGRWVGGDASSSSRSQGNLVLLKQNFMKNDADLISRLLPSDYWPPPQETEVYRPHSAAVTGLQSYHGKLYSSSADRTIKVHNTKNLHLSLKDQIACCSPVKCIEVHYRDKKPMLIAGCSDAQIFCYDLYTLQSRGKYLFSTEVEALHVRFRNLYVGLSDGSIFIIDLKRMCRTHSLKFDDHAQIYDNTSRKRAVKSIKSVVVCQNEGSLKRLLIIHFESVICILDAMDLHCIKKFVIQSLCLDVHKRKFYCGFENGELHYCDLEELREVKKFCKQNGEVLSMKITGDLLITSSSDFLIRFFSISTAKVLQVYRGHCEVFSVMETALGNQITIYSGNKCGEIRSFVANLNESIVCEWENCGLPFGAKDQLKLHILHEHIKSHIHNRQCKWKSCTHCFPVSGHQMGLEDNITHIESHLEIISS